MAFSLVPRDEKFFSDFIQLAQEIRNGSRLLKQMLSVNPPDISKAEEIKDKEHACDAAVHAIIDRLNAEVAKALALPDLKARFAAAGGLDPYLTSREDLAAHMRAEYEKFGKLIRAVGIKAD